MTAHQKKVSEQIRTLAEEHFDAAAIVLVTNDQDPKSNDATAMSFYTGGRYRVIGMMTEFLEDVKDLPHRNLAMEVLQKLLRDEIKVRSRRNVVQPRPFAEMLEQSIRRYQNRSIEVAQVIAELVELAKEMREAHKRGEELGLNDDEIAFYDALETNDSAVKVLGDDTLRTIARELVAAVRRNVSIDWTVRESARANIRRIVKRILRRYGYPPDKQEKATQTVIEQAEVLCADVAA